MFQPMTILRVVETLILDLPATLGHAVERATAHPWGGKVGQPESLDDLSVGFVLPVEEDPDRFPAQRLPGVKVVGVPDLDAVWALAESRVRGLGTKASLGGTEQLGQVVFQARDRIQACIADGMKKRRGGELPIDDHVVGKTPAQVTPRAPQQALTGGVFTITRSVGFDIEREGQPGSHHAEQRQVVSIADDLARGLAKGTTQGTARGAASPHGGSVHSQSDEAAGVESLVTFGLPNRPHQSGTGRSRTQPLGEVGQGIVAERSAHAQGAAGRRADQRFHRMEGVFPEQLANQQRPEQSLSGDPRTYPAVAGGSEVGLQTQTPRQVFPESTRAGSFHRRLCFRASTQSWALAASTSRTAS